MASGSDTVLHLEGVYTPSSTLIIAARTKKRKPNNYKLLLVKIAAPKEFTYGHYIFPGGVFDAEADDNREWLLYFQECGITSLQHLRNRPRSLMTNTGVLHRDISLRITAIRETFAKVGLLVCVKILDLKLLKLDKPRDSFEHNFDKLEWQKKVHKNPAEFLNLCKFLKVVPDLWSLQEWSTWRSPTTAPKKNDTAVYILTLSCKPKLLLEPTEIEKELWTTPTAALERNNRCSLWLTPLQFYEISRLENIKDWLELQTFIKKRNSQGNALTMFANFQRTDSLYKGDDFYPTNALDQKEMKKLNLTAAEFKDQAENIHRLIYYDMYTACYVSNIKPIDGHLRTVVQLNYESKL